MPNPEAQAIRLRAFVFALSLPATGLAVPWFGCSGDQSLGSGLPVRDAAVDGADVSMSPVGQDAVGMDQGVSCSNHGGIDAGGGLNEGLIVWYRCEGAAGALGTTLSDSTSHGNDGTLVTGTGGGPGYSFAAGKIGNALDLVLANQGHVTLPGGILAEACEVTIATWVYINSNVNAWTRIWDFGQDTNVYMFLTPITNMDDVARFGISVNGNSDEETIKAQMAVPTLRWTHVALVLGSSGATLYFDGASVGANPSVKLRPADLGWTVNNYIGRSQFSDDPYLDGNIDEFRIYNRALSPDEIRALANGS